LAITTFGALGVMLHRLHAATPTLAGLGRAALTVGALAVVVFGVAGLLLEPAPAALVGAALYAAALALSRPAALTGSWRYLRSLA
jgi:hypothetical protein